MKRAKNACILSPFLNMVIEKINLMVATVAFVAILNFIQLLAKILRKLQYFNKKLVLVATEAKR